MKCIQTGILDVNTYIFSLGAETRSAVIVDPGGSVNLIRDYLESQLLLPVLTVLTHGHFDHIWDNAKLQEHFENTPLVCHTLDAFLLESDVFDLGLTPSHPTMLVESTQSSQILTLGGVEVKFHHFPGHTPGCCMIEIEGYIFSGDFIFYRSIGRSDFAYSSPEDMRHSLLRFESMCEVAAMPLYPGHGERTIARDEQANVKFWLSRI